MPERLQEILKYIFIIFVAIFIFKNLFTLITLLIIILLILYFARIIR